MLDWTEKYRPKSINQLVGNRKTIQRLVHWARQWQSETPPQKKAVILSGPPGIGKTSCAYALASDFHWTPIELNTSDARNEQCIKSVATAGATHQTFDDQGQFIRTDAGGRKLIILDEADNLYERISGSSKTSTDLSDKGGKRTIIQTIRITHQPIILIVNDYYNLIKGSGSALKSLALHLRWYPPFPNEIQTMLHTICKNEQITAHPTVLHHISQQCNGDLRSAVRDLQSICVNKKQITLQDMGSLGNRDRGTVIFDALKAIFTKENASKIKEQIRNLDEDPRSLLFWITENIPTAYKNPYDRACAFDSVSKADCYLGRTFRRQYYRFWAYASDYMTIGVSSAKSQPVHPSKYRFPTWLKSKKKKKRAHNEEDIIIRKLSTYHHCSLKKTKYTIFPYYRILFQQNKDFARSVMKNLDLSDEEGMAFVDFSTQKAKQYLNELKEKENQNKKPLNENQDSSNKQKEKNNESEANNQQEQKLLFDF